MIEEYLIDALASLGGVRSSSKNVAGLLYDLPEQTRRFLRNRFPSLRSLLDWIPARDYHREGNPIVFIRHGLSTGASCWEGLCSALENYGINNHQYDFLHGVDDLARRLTVKIWSEKEEKYKRICAVGHSKGAIVLLKAYKKRPDLFERLVTLAPPYRGSNWAKLLPLFNFAYELRPKSNTIQDLVATPLPEESPILNIYTNRDEFILPPENAILPEQKNITNVNIPSLKHNCLLYDPIVHQMIRLFFDGVPFDGDYQYVLADSLEDKFSKRIEQIVVANGLR